ncbi:MAG: hypothetical protein QXS20_06410 [Candidatus Thorarchaeota archaeon]
MVKSSYWNQLPDMSRPFGEILDDYQAEAKRIVDAASSRGFILRILGCLAFRIQCPEYVDLHKSMGREVTDIDFAAYYKDMGKIRNLFRDDLGYTFVPPGFARATTLRDLFINPKTNFKVDVFYDQLEFCHKIELKKGRRLDVDPYTLPLAELFLEKTQIVEINAKDLKDLIILFLAHDISDTLDDSRINGKYIAKILSDDWGFYHTVTENLKKFQDFVSGESALSEEQRELIRQRSLKLFQLIENEPKTGGWKRRAAIGTKQRWYKIVHAMEGERK